MYIKNNGVVLTSENYFYNSWKTNLLFANNSNIDRQVKLYEKSHIFLRILFTTRATFGKIIQLKIMTKNLKIFGYGV